MEYCSIYQRKYAALDSYNKRKIHIYSMFKSYGNMKLPGQKAKDEIQKIKEFNE